MFVIYLSQLNASALAHIFSNLGVYALLAHVYKLHASQTDDTATTKLRTVNIKLNANFDK